MIKIDISIFESKGKIRVNAQAEGSLATSTLLEQEASLILRSFVDGALARIDSEINYRVPKDTYAADPEAPLGSN